ncbi:MAG TPA: hypothetical protein VL337_02525 [Acidimicrobiales bacterium]|nr:hypothetical protein [Acidimicrobiales bacterium]
MSSRSRPGHGRVTFVAGTVVLLALGPGATAAWAHGGAGSSADTVSAVLLTGEFGLMSWFLNLRRREMSPGRKRFIWVLVPVMLGVLGLALTAGAWAPKTKPSKNRPVTTARLAIVDPTPNEITGPDVPLRLELTGGVIVPQSSSRLSPTEGHVHLYVDGKLVSMTYGLSDDLKNLSPGPHSLRAEFVAADHAPFKNPVVAAVLIQVQASGAGTPSTGGG